VPDTEATPSATGFGARFGYLGNFHPAFSLGASYQTKINMGQFDSYAGLALWLDVTRAWHGDGETLP
jgi:hypothetical protein